MLEYTFDHLNQVIFQNMNFPEETYPEVTRGIINSTSKMILSLQNIWSIINITKTINWYCNSKQNNAPI